MRMHCAYLAFLVWKAADGEQLHILCLPGQFAGLDVHVHRRAFLPLWYQFTFLALMLASRLPPSQYSVTSMVLGSSRHAPCNGGVASCEMAAEAMRSCPALPHDGAAECNGDCATLAVHAESGLELIRPGMSLRCSYQTKDSMLAVPSVAAKANQVHPAVAP